MSRRFVIAGTDTDVGKTVFAAALVGALDGCYWKPIQAGLEYGGDAALMRLFTPVDSTQILPEVYRLATAASPHRAAEIDGVEIDVDSLVPPATKRPLVIELAGGLMVPLTRSKLQIDLLARWGLPVILCARTKLGTINHSLLSIEALNNRNIPIHGIAFIGDTNEDTERTICEMGNVRRLGRLPMVSPLNAVNIDRAFKDHFRREDFS